MEEPMQINVDTSDAVEMGPVDAGEYQVEIINTKFKQAEPGDENQWKGLNLILDIPDEVSAELIYHMQWIPDADNQEGKRYERTKSEFAKFKEAFGFGPAEAFELVDLQGRRAWARLRVKDDPERGPQNVVADWVTGPSSDGVAGTPSY